MASLSELTPEQQHAAVVLARLAAQREVKRLRQKKRIKGPIAFSVLSRMANEWLADHPELYAEAALSPIVQELGIVRKRRTVGRKGKSLFTTHVHNEGDQ
jgi:hypothetical protein